MNTVEYRGNLAANTDRGPSRTIWADCPIADILENPSVGMYFFDDFIMTGSADMSSAYKNSFGRWAIYGDAGAVQSDGAAEGGVLTLGVNDDNENVTLLSSVGSLRMVTTSTLALNKKLWFEARIAKSTITTQTIEAFVGLCTPSLSSNLPAANIPLGDTDDGLSTTPSLFGFHLAGLTATRGGPTEVGVAFGLASGTVNFPTNLTAIMAASGNSVLSAASFVKLGFIFDPDAYPRRISSATARQTAGGLRKPIIRFFVNGLETPAFLTIDDVQNATSGQAFPTAFMAPCISISNQAGTSPGTLSADWIQVAQMANT